MTRLAEAVPIACDCLSWRLDLFEQALERVWTTVLRGDPRAQAVLTYRVADDVAILLVRTGVWNATQLAFIASADGRLPGLRLLETVHSPEDRKAFLTRRLGYSDVVVP